MINQDEIQTILNLFGELDIKAKQSQLASQIQVRIARLAMEPVSDKNENTAPVESENAV